MLLLMKMLRGQVMMFQSCVPLLISSSCRNVQGYDAGWGNEGQCCVYATMLRSS